MLLVNMLDPKNRGNASSALSSLLNWTREYEIQSLKPHTYSRSILNAGFPSRPSQLCDVFLRCYPSTKRKNNYDDNDDDDNNNKFIVVFVFIILIIVIIAIIWKLFALKL